MISQAIAAMTGTAIYVTELNQRKSQASDERSG